MYIFPEAIHFSVKYKNFHIHVIVSNSNTSKLYLGGVQFESWLG
jgi:hypothetical protein